jgi:hypothetical protein
MSEKMIEIPISEIKALASAMKLDDGLLPTPPDSVINSAYDRIASAALADLGDDE